LLWFVMVYLKYLFRMASSHTGLVHNRSCSSSLLWDLFKNSTLLWTIEKSLFKYNRTSRDIFYRPVVCRSRVWRMLMDRLHGPNEAARELSMGKHGWRLPSLELLDGHCRRNSDSIRHRFLCDLRLLLQSSLGKVNIRDFNLVNIVAQRVHSVKYKFVQFSYKT